jgi:hypothetical protein
LRRIIIIIIIIIIQKFLPLILFRPCPFNPRYPWHSVSRPQRWLIRENTFYSFPWDSRNRTRKPFWKLASCLFMEAYSTLRTGEDTLIWKRTLWIALCGGTILKETLDLSSDRLLNNNNNSTLRIRIVKMC